MHQTIASNGRTQRLILLDNHQPCGLYTTPTLSVIMKYGSRKFTHSNFKQQSAPHTKISKTVTIAHTELHDTKNLRCLLPFAGHFGRPQAP